MYYKLTRNVILCALLFLVLPGSHADVNRDMSLINAARNNDYARVKSILNKKPDVNLASGDGATALHWAALRDNLELAHALLKAGADPGTANDYGATPLWLACTNRSQNMVESLLEAGADPNAALWSGETPLMNCARTGANGAVAALLDAGAYVDAGESTQGQTALMWAAAGGRAAITRLLIEHGADINTRTIATADKLPHSCSVCDWVESPGGFTPVLFAARSGEIATMRNLMEAGADPNQGTREHGNTLVIASAGGHVEMALFLLQMGADPNSSDETGLTPLHHAVGGGMALLNGVIYDGVYRKQPENSLKLARALLEAGADVNARVKVTHLLGPDGTPFDMEGATPLLLAATAADIEMMELLHDYGADPGINTKEGVTPLIAAAQSACTGTCAYQEGGNIADKDAVERAFHAVRSVYKMGVDINAANKTGRTAMHIAGFTGSDAVVQYLADHGAKVDVSDTKGETPWTMASGMATSIGNRGLYGNHKSTAALLLKLGAKSITQKELLENAPEYGGAGL